MNAKTMITAYLLALMLMGLFQEVNGQDHQGDESYEKPEIALLGVFHFAGSTGDAASINLDNIQGERRQEEIGEILDHLETYQPDKILVEYPAKRQDELDQAYQKYLDGDLELHESETHQLGFKLAKRLGHSRVYAIDYKLNLPFGDLQNYAKEHGMDEKLKQFISEVQARARDKEQYLEEHTILDYLRQLNTDEADLWNKNLYLGDWLEMGNDTIYPGAELAGEWYKRNLYWLANFDRVVEEGDRVLAIMGSGHRAILKQMVIDKQDFEYVEILPYLR